MSDDLTQDELDTLLSAVQAAWATLPVDYAGIWWVASAAGQEDPVTLFASEEGIGIDRQGNVHWYFYQDSMHHGQAIFLLTPDIRTLCRLSQTWPRFVSRMRGVLCCTYGVPGEGMV